MTERSQKRQKRTDSGAGSSGVQLPKDRISLALVCQSNVNRSMEAHALLKLHGYTVRSFGAGSKVRLPGESKDKPNIYEFGTPYDHIHKDLKAKNEARYTKNGMIQMIKRDCGVKKHPERWQDEKSTHFDLVITYEKRVYETVCQDIQERGDSIDSAFRPVHVVNLDTQDTHSEATTGASQTLDMIEKIFEEEDWEGSITAILDDYEQSEGKELLHTVMFY